MYAGNSKKVGWLKITNYNRVDCALNKKGCLKIKQPF